MTVPDPKPDLGADRARKLRSWAIALGLVIFVAIIFTVTFVRLQGNAAGPHF